MVAIIIIGASFIAGYFLRPYIPSEGSFSILDESHQILLEHGLNPPPEAPELEYGMIRGMLDAYDDPYTTFHEPADHELQTDSLHGGF